ncbi:hypothetical protein QE152_g13936 [Popillia japonica]|uniref:Uncharacterized protein n=1 Tax=Popillia japonica TaxID=7064 RepID=A0AAW1LAB2_POPJA
MEKGKSRILGQLFAGVERFDEPQAIVDAFANIVSRNFLPSGEIDISDAFSLHNSLYIQPLSEMDVVGSICYITLSTFSRFPKWMSLVAFLG